MYSSFVRQKRRHRVFAVTQEEERTANTGLAKVEASFSADTFVVTTSSVLRINICGENRHLRQARNRYG
jgi:hypothetical protein